MLSCADSARYSTIDSVFAARLPCESITAFGLPVVPDV
jgi:hypothetical protein